MTRNLTPAELQEMTQLNLQHISCGLSASANQRRIELSHLYNQSPMGRAAEAAFVDSIDR